jgi:predicted 2-oxoglutarate/Fe(II)-dependent dioxygenase YbiX
MMSVLPTGSITRPLSRLGLVSEVEALDIIGVIAQYGGIDQRYRPTFRNDRRIVVSARHLYKTGVERAAILVNDIVKRVFDAIVVHFGVREPLYPEYTVLQANFPGDFHVEHADNERYDDTRGRWLPNHTPNRVFSAGLYLNTAGSHFEGGSLVFTNGQEFAPATGLLVAFPSDHRFLHSVSPVTAGVRYSILTWFTFDVSMRERLLPPRAAATADGHIEHTNG